MTAHIKIKPLHTSVSLQGIPENAAFFSSRQEVFLDSPISFWHLLSQTRHLLQLLAVPAMQDGIMYGHLKAVLQVNDHVYPFSTTRADTIDEVPATFRMPDSMVSSFVLTVNLLSVLPCSLSEAEFENIIQTALQSGCSCETKQ